MISALLGIVLAKETPTRAPRCFYIWPQLRREVNVDRVVEGEGGADRDGDGGSGWGGDKATIESN